MIKTRSLPILGPKDPYLETTFVHTHTHTLMRNAVIRSDVGASGYSNQRDSVGKAKCPESNIEAMVLMNHDEIVKQTMT